MLNGTSEFLEAIFQTSKNAAQYAHYKRSQFCRFGPQARSFAVDRPAEFTVDLDLTGEKGLGLEVDWADGKTLFIKSVKAEGAVPSWNLAHQELPILAKDRVLSINGTSGDPKVMTLVRQQAMLAGQVWVLAFL
eukprot:s2720_g1.t1